MLTIVTGLTEEAAIARYVAAPGTLILCGQAQRDNIATLVPQDCTSIISFGLFGGLSPDIVVGQTVIADKLIDADGNVYMPDPVWRKRLFSSTKSFEHVWYSSGLYNTADTPSQRAAIFSKTGAHAIDDESLAVAKLAQNRAISFGILRSCSDIWSDTVPLAARNATNPDGSSNIASVLAWLEAHPRDDLEEIYDLAKIAGEYQTSIDELRTAALAVGPTFGTA
jgi:adenosylhomocysteine nucleosidase